METTMKDVKGIGFDEIIGSILHNFLEDEIGRNDQVPFVHVSLSCYVGLP